MPAPTARPSAAHLRLLKELTETVAVSGAEGPLRAIVRRQVEPHAESVRVDAMGNLLVTRRGPGRRRLRVMVSAHMDEVGMMVVAVTGEGLLKFEKVGSIDDRHLLGKPVWVGTDRIPGFIGAKPIHLMGKEEAEQAVKADSMTIDIGASDKAAAEARVRPGDWATFATPFRRLGQTIAAKALDNRLGVAALIELVQNPPPGIELLAAFTVQEEVGLRGARVAAYSLDPQAALALDCTPANDLPTWDGEENTDYNTRLGAGPAIYAADGRTLAHPGLLEHFIRTAERRKIPYQIRQPGGGATDAGVIHLVREGIPSLSLSVPGRYPHSPAGLASLADWRNTLKLAYAALTTLTPAVLRRELR
jgi:endoglucanase